MAAVCAVAGPGVLAMCGTALQAVGLTTAAAVAAKKTLSTKKRKKTKVYL